LYACFSQPSKRPNFEEVGAGTRDPVVSATSVWASTPDLAFPTAVAKTAAHPALSTSSDWEAIPLGASTPGPATQLLGPQPEKLECSVVIADSTRSNQGMFHHFLTTEFNRYDKEQPPKRTYKWQRLDTSGVMGRMMALVNMSEAYTIKDESRIENIIRNVGPPTGWGRTEDWVKRIIQALLDAKCISKVKSKDSPESIWTEMKVKSQKFLEKVQADERPMYGTLPAFKFREGRWMPPIPPEERLLSRMMGNFQK
jgi:hypothetical protein